MKLLQGGVGDLRHFGAITATSLEVIKNDLEGQVVLVIAFFRLGVEMHPQFFSEEARSVADAFERIPVKGIARQLVML
ncbi:MAG: hypothetical protein Q7R63_02630, partial [bacterium]|nr:hypothetical protein [bacterium]